MCGIAGIVSQNPIMVQQNKLQLMGNALQHRGPDGEGFWISENNTAGFTHRRLAVIDLSNNAAQPMQKNFAARTTGTLGKKLTIVFNGEIYNYIELRDNLKKKGYHFSTNSDTEVILALFDYYYDDCMQYLDGMFAFAIWDETHEELLIARDRFGEKPLYYFFDGEKLLFASEMKALWAAGVPKEVNNSMLLNYLGAGLVSNANNAAETFYSNIKKLPAANYFVYRPGNTEIETYNYWSLLNNIQPTSITENEAIEQLQYLLQQSVSRRLRSDVAIGTSLSGGLDSSSITAIIHQLKQSSVHSFSAVFPGFEKDESHYINTVNKKFSLHAHTVTPTATDFVTDFDKLLYHQEEPFQSSSIYAQYKVYELAKQNNVTVLLDGQGADETLAGYTKYYQWYWQELFRKSQWKLLGTEINAAKENGQLTNWGIKNYAAAILPAITAKLLSGKLKKQLQQKGLFKTDFFEANFNEASTIKPNIQSLTDILYYNTCFTGLEDLLRYADRNSMAHGREVRLPFLSHELVEFIFSLPSSYKIHNGFTKHILRAAMQQHLPHNIVWRKDKVGFEPPQQQWMQHKQIQEQIVESKKKLIAKGIIEKQSLDLFVQTKAAHDANNTDWWLLCAGSMV